MFPGCWREYDALNRKLLCFEMHIAFYLNDQIKSGKKSANGLECIDERSITLDDSKSAADELVPDSV